VRELSTEIRIELIIIGDEILNGRISDLNGPYLAKTLMQKGLILNNISVCGDSFKEIDQAVQYALARSRIIFITGGLGPTKDDITKTSMAKIFNKEMLKSKDAEHITIENYERYGKEWFPGQNHYNFIPTDFIPTQNFNGLAPGLIYVQESQLGAQHILLAPGVPKEFQQMLKEIFIPMLIKRNLCPDISKEQVVIKTSGIPEEKIFKEIYPKLWNDFSIYGRISSLPQRTGVNIIVSLHEDQNYDTVLSQIKNLILKNPLKDYVWQYGDLSLPELIIKKARDKNITFAFAESCTGGLSSSKITDVSGSSDVFIGGFITYSNELKVKSLDVSDQTLKKFGSVSEETVLEMAIGTLKKSNCDIAISWSGIAGPLGGTKEKPIGTLSLGWVSKDGESGTCIYHFKGDRLQLKNRFSDQGLMKLLSLI
jgi:nicotinamide-nucleotide amidase